MTQPMSEKSPRGIFLLYEGLPPTVVESQVLAHVRLMREAGVEMEVWAHAVTASAYADAKKALPRLLNDYGVPIRLFRGVRPAFPMSRQINAALLVASLFRRAVKPDFIHARTDYSAAVAATIKRFIGFRLIWDARGDTLSEFEGTASTMPVPQRWLAPMKYNAIRSRLRLAARVCDRAIFVSEALKALQGGGIDPSQTFVVPCLADESLFYFDPGLRQATRARLGYGERDLVILYSGSTALWQCVDETIALMARLLGTLPCCRALIVTSRPESFERLIPVALRDRFRVTSGSLPEVNAYLNAADVGVMLRQESPINRVASPIKFAEYCLAGLVVATTDAVAQVSEFGKEIGNIVPPEKLEERISSLPMKSGERVEIASRSKILLGRGEQVERIARVYRP